MPYQPRAQHSTQPKESKSNTAHETQDQTLSESQSESKRVPVQIPLDIPLPALANHAFTIYIHKSTLYNLHS
ncbi:predicted protein [Plenodomus lingam JN3]|uniref:Uncharacterized protein n=1 Tax=Leptosphaeria maculans (strain JN3 / isolate v23.1.3 / race Av1-4-5-6-7-8) TaxID=985895 RepID=E5A5W4_LEPMJ|nr:predicted protein [Plenodomus lingam JN3]CBX99009.1 predicted protein [Plenodomus lingam JN3]